MIPMTARNGALGALSILIALPGSAGAPAAYAAAPAEVVDGQPTPQACARYGYDPRNDRDEARGYPNRGRIGGRNMVAPYAQIAPAPSFAPQAMVAPPPPPPPPGLVVGEVAVTGSRVSKSIGPQPPMLPGPRAGSVETERYPDAQINPVKRTAEEPVSTFSIDVDTASYSNVRRFLHDGQRPPRDAVRVEELVNYFDYDYPRPLASEAPFRAAVAVAPSPWAPGKQVIHIGLQGYDIERTERPPLNLVFLVDVSGSMSGEDRLGLAVKSLNLLVDQLRPQDRVSLVVYAGAAGVVLQPESGAQKLKIRCALQALHAGGSTAGGQGLALAYSMAERGLDKRAVNRVILMTDGDFNVGVADPEKLEDFVSDKRKTGIYLSVYGYGHGNYNDVMMQTLAQSGNGTAAYVDSIEEGSKLFREDFASSLFPIADDVKIQVEFNPARVSEYRLIGYETRLLRREDFNNDRVDAGEVGAGASVTALYEITPAGGPTASDPLRYGEARPAPPPESRSGELAFLRIRYKRPGAGRSQLIERAIGSGDIFGRVELAPESTRFALAVAAFGQRLRADPYVQDEMSWTQIASLADGARGRDADGLRRQFVELARAADRTRSVNE